jgi:aromatic amino acid transport protein AroP
MLFPWNQVIGGGSPFVLVFSKLGNVAAANILNIVVFSAALSGYNSCVYASSRMLFSLAQQGNAPHFVEKLTKKGVPFAGVLVTALATFASVIINFLLPQRAFEILLALVIASALITWAMISVSHLKFKVAMKAKGITTSFKAILSPASNYLCLLFIVFIVMMMANSEQWMAVMLIPVWLSFLGIAYLYKRKWISNN